MVATEKKQQQYTVRPLVKVGDREERPSRAWANRGAATTEICSNTNSISNPGVHKTRQGSYRQYPMQYPRIVHTAGNAIHVNAAVKYVVVVELYSLELDLLKV